MRPPSSQARASSNSRNNVRGTSMNRLRLLVPLVLLAGALSVPAAASAAPVPVHLTVGSNAQYLSPSEIIVPVTVTCPVATNGFVAVSVEQMNGTPTPGEGFGFVSYVCTGKGQSFGVE